MLMAKLWQATNWTASMPPTILAWDWTAIRRTLLLEAKSPGCRRAETADSAAGLSAGA
jgi:hypothetical protein